MTDHSANIEPYLPCSECKKQTLVQTLTQYGARCHSCFEFYLTQASKTETANRREGPKAWAHHLRAREFAGARLTPAQRTMWREALHRELATEPA